MGVSLFFFFDVEVDGSEVKRREVNTFFEIQIYLFFLSYTNIATDERDRQTTDRRLTCCLINTDAHRTPPRDRRDSKIRGKLSSQPWDKSLGGVEEEEGEKQYPLPLVPRRSGWA